MQQFMRKFKQLNGKSAKIILEHCLFDKQVFDCDTLQIIDDDKRIGLVIKQQDIFMYKPNVKIAEPYADACIMSDGRLTIKIFLK